MQRATQADEGCKGSLFHPPQKDNRNENQHGQNPHQQLAVGRVDRPEDWPILPVHLASFKLEPVCFFDENPAIDVPPEHAIKDIHKRREEQYDNPDAVAGDD